VPVKLTFIDHAVTACMWASVLNVMSWQYKYQSHHLLNTAIRIQEQMIWTSYIQLTEAKLSCIHYQMRWCCLKICN